MKLLAAPKSAKVTNVAEKSEAPQKGGAVKKRLFSSLLDQAELPKGKTKALGDLLGGKLQEKEAKSKKASVMNQDQAQEAKQKLLAPDSSLFFFKHQLMQFGQKEQGTKTGEKLAPKGERVASLNLELEELDGGDEQGVKKFVGLMETKEAGQGGRQAPLELKPFELPGMLSTQPGAGQGGQQGAPNVLNKTMMQQKMGALVPKEIEPRVFEALQIHRVAPTQRGGVLEFELKTERAHRVQMQLEIQGERAKLVCRCEGIGSMNQLSDVVDHIKEIMADIGYESDRFDLEFQDSSKGEQGESEDLAKALESWADEDQDTILTGSDKRVVVTSVLRAIA